MFHTRTEIEYRVGAPAAILPTIVAVDKVADESSERRRRVAAERALDQVLEDSFPASDPPSWNPGVALVNPAASLGAHGERSEAVGDTGVTAGATDINVSRPSADRTFLQGLVSLAGAVGIALLVPFVILLIGLPIALSVRGVLELLSLFFGVVP